MNPRVPNHHFEKVVFQFVFHQKTELRQKTFLAEKNRPLFLKFWSSRSLFRNTYETSIFVRYFGCSTLMFWTNVEGHGISVIYKEHLFRCILIKMCEFFGWQYLHTYENNRLHQNCAVVVRLETHIFWSKYIESRCSLEVILHSKKKVVFPNPSKRFGRYQKASWWVKMSKETIKKIYETLKSSSKGAEPSLRNLFKFRTKP